MPRPGGLALNFAPLEVDEIEKEEEMTVTWSIGKNGTMRHKESGVAISTEGLTDQEGNQFGFSAKDVQVADNGKLGQGAGGVVRHGLHTPTGMQLAVKSLKIDDKEKRHQLVNELRGLIKVQQCDGLVQMYGAFTSKKTNQVHVILELMNLGSLRSLLQRCPSGVPEGHLASMCSQVLVGLHYLHLHKTLHRDIKPENVLHNEQGEVKLTDFGISKEMNQTIQVAHTFIGTATYMAPERANGDTYSFISDVWSFGMVAYELATGVYPFPSMTNFTVLYDALFNKPEPRLDPEKFSPAAQDFIALQLLRDIEHRQTTEALLRHEFLQTASPREEFAAWLATIGAPS